MWGSQGQAGSCRDVSMQSHPGIISVSDYKGCCPDTSLGLLHQGSLRPAYRRIAGERRGSAFTTLPSAQNRPSAKAYLGMACSDPLQRHATKIKQGVGVGVFFQGQNKCHRCRRQHREEQATPWSQVQDPGCS